MRKTADVVIIGAGISGLAIGVHLAKKGVKDIVIPVSYTHLDVYKRQELQ